MGETVGVAALIDASNPAYYRSLSKFKILYLSARFFVRRVFHHIRSLSDLKPRERSQYLSGRLKSLVHLAGGFARSVKGGDGDEVPAAVPQDQLDALEGEGELEKTLSRVMYASRLAAGRFVPKPYSGHLLIFRAKQHDEDPYEDDALGWRPLALGGVTTYEIDGDHMTIFRKPKVNEIAKILDEAQRVENPAQQEGILAAPVTTHPA
jgi:hypothetical protein